MPGRNKAFVFYFWLRRRTHTLRLGRGKRLARSYNLEGDFPSWNRIVCDNTLHGSPCDGFYLLNSPVLMAPD